MKLEWFPAFVKEDSWWISNFHRWNKINQEKIKWLFISTYVPISVWDLRTLMWPRCSDIFALYVKNNYILISSFIDSFIGDYVHFELHIRCMHSRAKIFDTWIGYFVKHSPCSTIKRQVSIQVLESAHQNIWCRLREFCQAPSLFNKPQVSIITYIWGAHPFYELQ